MIHTFEKQQIQAIEVSRSLYLTEHEPKLTKPGTIQSYWFHGFVPKAIRYICVLFFRSAIP